MTPPLTQGYQMRRLICMLSELSSALMFPSPTWCASPPWSQTCLCGGHARFYSDSQARERNCSRCCITLCTQFLSLGILLLPAEIDFLENNPVSRLMSDQLRIIHRHVWAEEGFVFHGKMPDRGTPSYRSCWLKGLEPGICQCPRRDRKFCKAAHLE